MMSTEPEQAFADTLTASGRLGPTWRAAYEAVPRHQFIPAVAWVVPDGPEPGYPIDRGQDPDGWMRAVYSDASIVTQLDDGDSDLTTGKGTPSSSGSAPGIVFAALDTLDIRDHHRVMEIGTGTGWTAALLSQRVGAHNVVSIEVDEQVAGQAEKNLTAAGHTPHLIVGDGAAGCPPRAPYDRVHGTCAVATFPYAWVEQTRPGGVIVAPWAPLYGSGQLARLVVDTNGRASGRFPALVSYMMLRSQRRTVRWNPHHADEARETTTRIDPRTLAEAPYAADLMIGALVPGVARIPAPSDDGSGRFSLLFVEAEKDDAAWAAVDYVPGEAEYRVTSFGHRDLWQEVSDAFLRWIACGQPERRRFGLTVTPEGQRLWLDDPCQPVTS
ncbi:methyltransferase domain-containing protein [Streptomyces sp. 110]|uniref:Protein-L-isoaspartate O-methyltransferase n=1 Tax=Streptomyces endocoffeicus TaxID=2898945 RepID=A0ABS1Q2E7_9ACTN|nr:methyltransferase domain-containing protein [Streptomyces endocoffeicus]MBL1118834.1 methyltransferase domain-containing protein [Streptomyces endocoffeicus]